MFTIYPMQSLTIKLGPHTGQRPCSNWREATSLNTLTLIPHSGAQLYLVLLYDHNGGQVTNTYPNLNIKKMFIIPKI